MREIDPKDASFLALAAEHEQLLRNDGKLRIAYLKDIKDPYCRSIYKVLVGMVHPFKSSSIVVNAVVKLRQWAKNCRTIHSPSPKRIR